MKTITLKDYYTVGDNMCEARYGRHGQVKAVTKRSVTFKMEHSTKKVTLHSLDDVEEFYKAHPVV